MRAVPEQLSPFVTGGVTAFGLELNLMGLTVSTPITDVSTFDPTFSLVTHPVVNDYTGLFWGVHIVHQPQPGTIVLGQNVQEFWQELVIHLTPDGIDDLNPETFFYLSPSTT